MHYNSKITHIKRLNRLRIIGRLYCFNIILLDIINVIVYKNFMRDKTYFLHPVHEWQRRYEAMRASKKELMFCEAKT